jgi:hypothetical protein
MEKNSQEFVSYSQLSNIVQMPFVVHESHDAHGLLVILGLRNLP